MEIGYTLSSEEHGPRRLVDLAVQAEQSGFDFLTISDHFHPWVSNQGESPFVWATIGGVAIATERIPLAVGVTCPILRIHPAIVAQAAATATEMMPGRFALGVGTGELLNEHVTGQRWPSIEERREMLEEAVDIMRKMWTGDNIDHRGAHYRVENARLFTCPDEPPPVIVSAFGPAAAELAARIGDGIWSTSPAEETIDEFDRHGGRGPRYGQVTLCWAENENDGVKTVKEQWPNTGLPGQLAQELPTPTTFEQAASTVTDQMLAEQVPCGPDPDRVVEVVRTYERSGYDHIHLHQIGHDQEGFLRFFRDELRSRLG
jgi:coenzyme F420-dependent glucose-6-phosphate dehydrogenase